MRGYILTCSATLVLALFLFVLNSYAEDATLEKAGIDDAALKECMDNFTIENVDFEDEKNLANSHFLIEYFICRAVVNDDINECNSLVLGECQRSCQRPVLAYWGEPTVKLMRVGMVTPDIIKASMDQAVGVGKDKEAHLLLFRAILDKDPSLCDKIIGLDRQLNSKCKALAALDVKSCPDKFCRDKVFFMQAVRDSNVEICKKISEREAIWVCRSAVIQDLKVCKESEGYKKFKKIYCENMLKGVKDDK